MGTAEDYRNHIRMIYRVCLRMLKDPAAAEDAAQDTFVKYLRSDFAGRSKVTTYLYSIATRTCLDVLRKRGRDEHFRRAWTQRTGSAENGISTDDAGAETMVYVGELLDPDRLDDMTAEIVAGYFIHGMTEQEIADMTGMKRRTVGYRLEAFRKQVRNRAGEGQDER